MRDRIIKKSLTVILVLCLMSSIPVYAADAPDEEILINAAPELVGEKLAESASEDVSEENSSGITDVSGEESEQVETDARIVSEEDREEPEVHDVLQIPEELTGAYWYYFIETGTQYDFKCYNITDYNCYMFTPETEGTYRVDVMNTTGQVHGTILPKMPFPCRKPIAGPTIMMRTGTTLLSD